MPGCVSEPLGCGLIDTPGKCKRPRLAQLAGDRIGAVAASCRTEEAAVGFECDRRCGEAERRDFGGDEPALRGAARMKRLGHRAEVLAQSGGLARADSERAAGGLAIQAEEAGGSCGSPDRTAGRRAVETVLVVPGQDGFGHLAFDFDADLIGGHHVPAAAMVALRHGQNGWQRRRGRMREQPVDTVLRHRELRVVKVVGVYGETVRERGKARGQAHAGADHDAALSARDAERLEVALRDAACLRYGTGKRQAQTVENRAPSQVRDVRWNILRPRRDDEVGDIRGQRRFDWRCGRRGGHGVRFL